MADNKLEEDDEPAVVEPSIKKQNLENKVRFHYSALNTNEEQICVNDTALVVAEGNANPFICLITDIFQDKGSDSKGPIKVEVLWMYRPEEALKKDKKSSFEADDPHILYFSSHRDIIEAKSIMHTCVVHFIPPYKPLPDFHTRPGFVIQHIYCTKTKKLFSITDNNFVEEMAVLKSFVERSGSVWKSLPDLVPEPSKLGREADAPKQLQKQGSKRMLPKSNSNGGGIMHNGSGGESLHNGGLASSPHPFSAAEEMELLTKFDLVTGNVMRDKHRAALLAAARMVLGNENMEDESNMQRAAEAVSGLEEAATKKFGLENKKYNAKLRSMASSFKTCTRLTMRLIKKELKPELVLDFDPQELRDGEHSSEKIKEKEVEIEMIEWTDSICSSCNAKKVAIKNIISTGKMDKYSLECQQCGHAYFSSPDQVTRLTVPPVDAQPLVGTQTSATQKFGAGETSGPLAGASHTSPK